MITRMAAAAWAILGLATPVEADPAAALIGVLAADAPTEAAGRAPAAAAPKLAFLRAQTCGTAANSFLCGTVLRQGFIDYSLPTRSSARSRPTPVDGPQGARLVVTWVGTVYCELMTEPANAILSTDPRYVSAVVNLQLQANRQTPVVPNGDGSATAGFQRSTTKGDGKEFEVSDFQIYPISLTRVFTKTTGAAETYFAAMDFEIRRGIGVCNVNGGTLTVLIVR